MKYLDKAPQIVIVVALIVIIACCGSRSGIEDEISSFESRKNILEKQLKMCGEIEEHYGRASEGFYSDKAILVLDGIDSTGVVRIYGDSGGNGFVAYRNPENLGTKWGESKNYWSSYEITSKVSSGYERVRFFNEGTEEEFYILVIIK